MTKARTPIGTLSGRHLGLIGDVHAEDELLGVALLAFERAGITEILCTGDIVDGPGSVDRCCSLLRGAGALLVRGNHDRWLLSDTMRDLSDAIRREDLAPETQAFLRDLPEERLLASPLGGLILCHGLGENDMSSVSADDFGYALENNFELQALIDDPAIAVVINGHTHAPMVRHFDGLVVVNAGTLFHRHDPGYVVVDFESGDVAWRGLGAGAGEHRCLGSLLRP